MKIRSPHVPHRKRQEICHDALHVTFRLSAGLPSLRQDAEFECITESIEEAQERFGCRIIEFSVMSNHIHLVVEAPDKESLARAMKGLKVRIVRALNKLWKRTGSIFSDRYYASAMKTVRHASNALRYVLNNGRRHYAWMRQNVPDKYSSGPWYRHWKERNGQPFRTDRCPVVPPRSRVLQEAMKLAIGVNEVPGPFIEAA